MWSAALNRWSILRLLTAALPNSTTSRLVGRRYIAMVRLLPSPEYKPTKQDEALLRMTSRVMAN